MIRTISTCARGLLVLVAWAVVPASAQDEGYLGDASCVTCHESQLHGFEKTTHAKVLNEINALSAQMKRGCESCHGPGRAHVEAAGGYVEGLRTFRAADSDAIEAENRACSECHGGGAQMYWDGSAHDTQGLACTSCHAVHAPKSERHQLNHPTETETCASCHLVQRARQRRGSRMPLEEGHMQCSSCHNAHGTAGPSLIAHVTINDNCLSCHADKRGPFLWEHPPVQEDCLSCHVPHGSSKEHMLRASQPRLCQQCHVATRHPSEPHGRLDGFVSGASCSNCHINIHGSNHPSGSVFAR